MVWPAVAAATQALSSPAGQGLLATGPAFLQGAWGLLHKSKFDKENIRALENLQGLQAKGQLGLTDEEYQQRARDLQAPVQAAATQVQQQQARALAAGGRLGGRDLSAMRSESAQMLGSSGQQVQAALDQASEAKEAAQIAEMDARKAAEANRVQGIEDNFWKTINMSAKALGEMGGAPPGTNKATGTFGSQPVAKTTTTQAAATAAPAATEAFQREMSTFLAAPDSQRIFQQALAGENLQDPQVARLRQLLEQAAVTEMEAAASAPPPV
jgi:hypothetical protein